MNRLRDFGKNVVTAAFLMFCSSPALYAQCNADGAIDAKACFGAKGDLQSSKLDCSISASSTSLSCTAVPFTSADVGKQIYVDTAGAGKSTLQTTITAWVSSTTVILAQAAAAQTSNVYVVWATDDTSALQNAYNNALASSRPLYIPSGGYLHHGLNWTGSNGGKIYGDSYGRTDLYAFAVTNPGKINNPTFSVGVDISNSSYNEIDDISFFGGVNVPAIFPDMPPGINLFGARVANTTGSNLSVGHTLKNIYSETNGAYSVVLYAYEQTDFLDSQFQVDNPNTALAALYLSSANSKGFTSPYVTVAAANSTSMTKVSLEGARTAFVGPGNMIVLDQGSGNGIYSISISDAYASTAPNTGGDCSFLVDTGTTAANSALRDIVLQSDYMETETSENCTMVRVNGPAFGWTLNNVQKYGPNSPPIVGNTYDQFIFNGGFLDSVAQIDNEGQSAQFPGETAFASLSAPSCAGSSLHLGSEEASTNCTDYLTASGISVNNSTGVASVMTLPETSVAWPMNSGGTTAWYKLGTWVGLPGTIGPGPLLIFSEGRGTNSNGGYAPAPPSMPGQQTISFLTMRTGNNSIAPNLSGISLNAMGLTSILSLKAVATGFSTSASNDSWDVYIEQTPYSQMTYTVSLPEGSKWIPGNVAASDPGQTSSTVVLGTINTVAMTPSIGAAYTGTKTAGSCTISVVNGVVTNISGC